MAAGPNAEVNATTGRMIETAMHRSVLQILLAISVAISPMGARASDIQSGLVAIAKDPSSTRDVLSRLVKENDAKAIAALGVMLFDGTGVAINHPAAMPLLLKAAELGRPEAMQRLGLAYSQVWGHDYLGDPPVDKAVANEWFSKARRAAEAGDPHDPAVIMVLALNTVDPTMYDPGAINLIKRAAELGYPEAEAAPEFPGHVSPLE